METSDLAFAKAEPPIDLALGSITTVPVQVPPLLTTPADIMYEPVVQLKVAACAVVGNPHARVNEAVKTAITFIKRDENRCFFDSALVLAINSGAKGETLWRELFFNMRMKLPLNGR